MKTFRVSVNVRVSVLRWTSPRSKAQHSLVDWTTWQTAPWQQVHSSMWC